MDFGAALLVAEALAGGGAVCPRCGRVFKRLLAHRKGNRRYDTVEGCSLK